MSFPVENSPAWVLPEIEFPKGNVPAEPALGKAWIPNAKNALCCPLSAPCLVPFLDFLVPQSRCLVFSTLYISSLFLSASFVAPWASSLRRLLALPRLPDFAFSGFAAVRTQAQPASCPLRWRLTVSPTRTLRSTRFRPSDADQALFGRTHRARGPRFPSLSQHVFSQRGQFSLDVPHVRVADRKSRGGAQIRPSPLLQTRREPSCPIYISAPLRLS